MTCSLRRSICPVARFCEGVGVTVALPLLDAMIPAAHGARATPPPRRSRAWASSTSRTARSWQRWTPDGDRHGLRDAADPQAARAVQRAHDDRQRPAQQGGREPQPARDHRGHVAGLRARRRSARRRTAASARDQIAAQHIGQDTTLPSLELAGEGGGGACDPQFGCSYQRHRRLPHADAAAADGAQPAQGVLSPVRAGRYRGRAPCDRR